MELCSSEQCTGCTACKNACPMGCISMHPDQYGFLYPKIDTETCINCGKCRAACPIINDHDNRDLNLAFAVTHHSRRILNQSSSGGAFSAIAQWCIDHGGVVYGAAFDENFQVHHVAVNDKRDIALLCGAKYVQSDLGKTYLEVKELLEDKRMVVFSGTPCQTAGLKSYLGKDYEQLFLIDVICHSVPSPLAWGKYLKWIEKRLGEQPKDVSFRNKKYGWESYSLSFRGKNRSVQEFGRESRFIQAFQSGLITRESCASCKFKEAHHISDLTLGDFWGCASVAPEAYCEYGTSLVVAHSKKGLDLIKNCREVVLLSLDDSESAIKCNPAYSQVLKMNPKRQAFMQTIINEDFEAAVMLYSEEFTDLDQAEKEILKKYYSFTSRSIRNLKQKLRKC